MDIYTKFHRRQLTGEKVIDNQNFPILVFDHSKTRLGRINFETFEEEEYVE